MAMLSLDAKGEIVSIPNMADNPKSASAFKQALESSSYGGLTTRSNWTQSRGWSYAYDILPDTRTGVERDLESEAAKAGVRAKNAGLALDTSRRASDARAAFASGKATQSRKRFTGKRTNAFAAIGRLDKANIAAKNAEEENAVELGVLSNQVAQERQKREDLINRARNKAPRQPITIFH